MEKANSWSAFIRPDLSLLPITLFAMKEAYFLSIVKFAKKCLSKFDIKFLNKGTKESTFLKGRSFLRIKLVIRSLIQLVWSIASSSSTSSYSPSLTEIDEIDCLFN